MALSIFLLGISAIILLFFTTKSRYGLTMFLLTAGLLGLQTSVLFQTYSTLTYTPPEAALFRSIELTLYRYIGCIRVSMPMAQRIRNLGLMFYLFGIARLMLILYGNQLERPGRFGKLFRVLTIAALLILPLLLCLFFSHENAYRLYMRYYALCNVSRPGYRLFVERIYDLLRLLLAGTLLFPIFFLVVQYTRKRLTCFRDTLIILILVISLSNFTFLLPSFFVELRMQTEWVFSSGFWYFPGAVRIPTTYTTLVPLLSLSLLIFTIANANRIFGTELVFKSRQRTLNRRIEDLNKNMKEIFHSEKNLLFSIQILVDEAVRLYGTSTGLEKLTRIQDIVSHRMQTISSSLTRIRELHINANSVDIKVIASDVMCQMVFPHDVIVRREYCDEPALCYIDPYHTGNAIHNLLTNSLEALALSERADKRLVITIQKSRQWVLLSVYDNGPGIESQALSKVMMPFFSTKSKSENWGIGLPYVFRVINAQLGQIHIQSSDEHLHAYTQVDILLPLARRKDKYD